MTVVDTACGILAAHIDLIEIEGKSSITGVCFTSSL